MKPTLWVLLLFFGLAGLSACLPVATPLPPTETPTPAPPTETPTPTIVWFPATPTYTPYPTPTGVVTATIEARPMFGQLLFSDDFTDQSQWTQSKAGSGSVAVSKGELTVAVARAKTYLFSQRLETQLTDFYLEVTASPSICRGADEYGVLFRVSSGGEFYRFALTCKGEARVDRYVGGKASSPQKLTISGAIPPGAPSMSRLAVLAVGPRFDFFVNGQFLYSVRDPSLLSGSVGVFARSAGEDAVTVNFSDLDVYEAKP